MLAGKSDPAFNRERLQLVFNETAADLRTLGIDCAALVDVKRVLPASTVSVLYDCLYDFAAAAFAASNPILMLFVGIGVVIFLLTFVIPKVTQIFSDMGRALPVPTQILLAVSDGIRSGWWIILLLVLCIMIGVWRMRRTEGGKRYAHRLLLRLPGIAGIYRPLIVGHMTRTLGMLLKNGVTLLKALHIVKSVADNKLMAQAVQNMIDGVQAGRDLSEFMNDPLVFPPLSRQMVAAGERSGQLGEMLLWVANDSENRVASRLQVVTSLMEPVMILLLGGIVGFVVIAIILPIFEMSTLAG